MAPWWMVALLVLLGGTVALIVLATRARRSGKSDAAVLGTTSAVSVVVVVIAALGALVITVSALVDPQVAIAIPVEEHWPALPPGTRIEGPTAERVSGGFTSATVTVSGLSIGARISWALGQALAWIVPGAVAALVVLVCKRVRDGRPFAPVLARATMIVAVVVAVGGTASQVLGDVAGSMASHELLEWSGMVSSAEDAAEQLLEPALLVTFPFWPIGAGLGLAALAVVLRRGRVLERDTEGLV